MGGSEVVAADALDGGQARYRATWGRPVRVWADSASGVRGREVVLVPGGVASAARVLGSRTAWSWPYMELILHRARATQHAVINCSCPRGARASQTYVVRRGQPRSYACGERTR